MVDLTTTYMGLKLKHPVVPSASPLSDSLDKIKRLEDAGAAAIVMYSLFEEQIVGESHLLDHYLSYGAESFAEALDYFPEMEQLQRRAGRLSRLAAQGQGGRADPDHRQPERRLDRRLGGVCPHDQEAGADALELNIYYIPTDPALTSAEVEEMYLDVVRDVKASISIPLAVKVGPYFSSFANMAMRLSKAGADGLVIFNRFYQPDFDLERLEVVPNLTLSSAWELRTPIRWVSILYGKVPVDFAVTRGVHSYEDVLKGVMAGANVTMMASELLRNGVQRIGLVVQEVAQWLEDHEYHSLKQARGSMSQQNVAEPAAFERANYMKVLQSWKYDPTGVLLR